MRDSGCDIGLFWGSAETKPPIALLSYIDVVGRTICRGESSFRAVGVPGRPGADDQVHRNVA